MCQVFGSGSNSTYTVSIMPAVGPGTHGTIFFGIYSKNRADQCPRVCLQRCNRSPFKIPKHDNTPPYRFFFWHFRRGDCKLPEPSIRNNHQMKMLFSTIIILTMMNLSTTVTLSIHLLLTLSTVI